MFLLFNCLYKSIIDDGRWRKPSNFAARDSKHLTTLTAKVPVYRAVLQNQHTQKINLL